MIRLVATVIVIVWALSCSAVSLAAGITDQDLLKVAADLGNRYDITYGARDPAAMAMIYADDGVLISPAGPIVRGRAALKAYYAKRFASGARNHRIKVVEVHALGDGGYGICTFSVTVPQANGELHEEHGTIVAVYRRDAAGWHMSLVAPSVPPGAGK